MAKSNQVLVEAMSELTDNQLRRLSWHLKNKTPIACNGQASVINGKVNTLFAMASTTRIPSKRFKSLTAMPKNWMMTLTRLANVVPPTRLTSLMNRLSEDVVRQSIRTAMQRRSASVTA